jgi:hypothetical protein
VRITRQTAEAARAHPGRAAAPRRPSARADGPGLARALGNRDYGRLIQPKLAVGPVDDPLEREADRAAEAAVSGAPAVVRSAAPSGDAGPRLRRCACGGRCPECRKRAEEEGRLRRDALGGAAPAAAPPLVHQVLGSAGAALDAGTRGRMGEAFGADFSGVRVHADARAARSADAVGARAYTVGSDVVFAAGRYAPGTREGDRLLAHELAHVVQQSGGAPLRVQRQAEPAAAAEALEADPEAFRGIDLYYMVRTVPWSDFVDTRRIVRRGPYLLVPQLRRAPDGRVTVVFYLAYRPDPDRRRNEFVVGPDALGEFTASVDTYVQQANLAYAWVPPGGQPSEVQALSALYVRGTVSGNPKEAEAGLQAWGAAVRDPGWLLSVATGVAGAYVSAAPRPPSLRALPGGGGAGAPAMRPPAVLARGGAVGGPGPGVVTRGGAALAVAPAPAPVAAPVAGAAPRASLSLVPRPEGLPYAPVAPVPAPAAAAAAAAATVARSGTRTGVSPATSARAAPRPAPSPDEEETDRRGCRVEQVAMKFGRYPCHADFSFALSGVRREFRVTTPEGLAADFDAMDAAGTVYEVKTGYRWVPFTADEPDTRVLVDRFQDQAFRQLAVAERCGRPLVWYFNEDVVARFFDGLLPTDVRYRPFPCNVDSDPVW